MGAHPRPDKAGHPVVLFRSDLMGPPDEQTGLSPLGPTCHRPGPKHKHACMWIKILRFFSDMDRLLVLSLHLHHIHKLLQFWSMNKSLSLPPKLTVTAPRIFTFPKRHDIHKKTKMPPRPFGLHNHIRLFHQGPYFFTFFISIQGKNQTIL